MIIFQNSSDIFLNKTNKPVEDMNSYFRDDINPIGQSSVHENPERDNTIF